MGGAGGAEIWQKRRGGVVILGAMWDTLSGGKDWGIWQRRQIWNLKGDG